MTTTPTNLITRTRALCEAATPGPCVFNFASDCIRQEDCGEDEIVAVLDMYSKGDGELFAAAPTLLLELADALESTSRRLAIHEGGLRDDTLRALNRQPELIRERDEARAECERLRKEG